MTEVRESLPQTPKESAERKISRLIWSDEDIKVVGEFLSSTKEFGEGDPALWKEVAEKTDFENEEIITLLDSAERFAKSVNLQTVVEKSDYEKEGVDEISQKEYDYSSVKRSETILSLSADALRKFGILGPEDSRRMVSEGKFRSEEKSGFSEIEAFDEKATSSKYVKTEEGGPNLKSIIRPPVFKEGRRLEDERVRGSLAHEIAHNLRALSNNSFWQGYEDKARSVELREPGTPEKQKYIKGFYVGSNKQGSEAIGELFAAVANFKARGGKYPTIVEITPNIAKRFSDSLEKTREKVGGYEKELKKYKEGEIDEKPEAPKSSYFAARYALLSHLTQLNEAGFGDVSALELLAFGVYGYVSFEKMPALVQLGVTTRKKQEKMRQVVINIADWLTDKGHKGFKLESRNI